MPLTLRSAPSGTVVDTVVTVPVTGVTLTLDGTASATVTTDGDGRYTFAGLRSGSYTITPQHAFQVVGDTRFSLARRVHGRRGLSIAGHLWRVLAHLHAH